MIDIKKFPAPREVNRWLYIGYGVFISAGAGSFPAPREGDRELYKELTMTKKLKAQVSGPSRVR